MADQCELNCQRIQLLKHASSRVCVRDLGNAEVLEVIAERDVVGAGGQEAFDVVHQVATLR